MGAARAAVPTPASLLSPTRGRCPACQLELHDTNQLFALPCPSWAQTAAPGHHRKGMGLARVFCQVTQLLLLGSREGSRGPSPLDGGHCQAHSTSGQVLGPRGLRIQPSSLPTSACGMGTRCRPAAGQSPDMLSAGLERPETTGLAPLTGAPGPVPWLGATGSSRQRVAGQRRGAEPVTSRSTRVWEQGRGPAPSPGPGLPAAPSSREASRPPEEPSTPSPTLPAQFKQRAPMYNSGLSPATPTPAAPTSPLTPTTPPAVAPTTQTPPVAMVAPQTQASAQQQPKKNLSLTVGVPWRGPQATR